MASWEERMKMAAAAAAKEAASRERARCLWVLDAVVEDLERALKRKLLTPAQTQLTELRMRIVRSHTLSVRRAIITGLSPSDGQRPLLDDAHQGPGQDPGSSAPPASEETPGAGGDFPKRG